MHHPLRTASAEPATLTSAAAYEGAVMTTTYTLNRAVTCPDGGVRFGAYNGSVTTKIAPTNDSEPASATPSRSSGRLVAEHAAAVHGTKAVAR